MTISESWMVFEYERKRDLAQFERLAQRGLLEVYERPLFAAPAWLRSLVARLLPLHGRAVTSAAGEVVGRAAMTVVPVRAIRRPCKPSRKRTHRLCRGCGGPIVARKQSPACCPANRRLHRRVRKTDRQPA